MSNKYISTFLASILLILAITVLGCTGSQAPSDNQTSVASATPAATPTTSPTSAGIIPTINLGKQDLLAPYKNPDGSFKDKITDESINQSYVNAAWSYAAFKIGHPDLKDLDVDASTNPSVKWSITMYQENKYKTTNFEIDNAKDKSGNNHNVKITIVNRETGDEPKTYVSHATLDGKDLLPTYPADAMITIPTRLTISPDKLLD